MTTKKDFWDNTLKHCSKEDKDYIASVLCKQIMYERDLAIQQLKDLGCGLGEKPKENNGEWIPVSERLPEEDKEVLIFTKDKEINKAYHTLKEWSDTQWEWFVFGTLGYSLTYSDDEVLAWQPLPEPYKENDTWT